MSCDSVVNRSWAMSYQEALAMTKRHQQSHQKQHSRKNRKGEAKISSYNRIPPQKGTSQPTLCLYAFGTKIPLNGSCCMHYEVQIHVDRISSQPLIKSQSMPNFPRPPASSKLGPRFRLGVIPGFRCPGCSCSPMLRNTIQMMHCGTLYNNY